MDTVDGKALSERTRISVKGIVAWPDDTAATMEGAEMGTLRYLHLAETNYGPGDERWKGPRQELSVTFHVSKVIKPVYLELGKD